MRLQSKVDRYHKVSKIGEGSYGIVYKARDNFTQQVVAIKSVKICRADEGLPYTAMREISILKEVQPHPHLIHLRGVQFDPLIGRLELIFDYMDCSLKTYLSSRKDPLERSEALQVLKQIIAGAKHLHQRGILHRDLKPQNVLVSVADRLIKIADFGLTRSAPILEKTLTRQVQTLYYRAPEIMLGHKYYDYKVDVWSIGCIFAEMRLGSPLFAGDCEIEQLFKIFQFLGTPKEKDFLASLPDFSLRFPKFRPNQHRVKGLLSPQEWDLLQKLLALNPQDRISLEEAWAHPLLSAAGVDAKEAL